MKKQSSELVKSLIELLETKDITIKIVADKETEYMYMKAADVFGVLHDLLWGEFYRTNLKYGDAEKNFKSISEALEAYRAEVGKLMEERNINLEEIGY